MRGNTLRNYSIKINEKPEPHWIKGGLSKGTKKFYNNGVNKRKFIEGTEPEGWVLGSLNFKNK